MKLCTTSLKNLPKYKIDIGVVNAQVSRALLMCDDHRVNEDEENVEPGSEEVSATGTAVDSTSAPSIGMCIPARPTMGEKKAKNFEFNQNKQNAIATSAKKAKVEVIVDLTRDMLVSRQVSLNKLVEAAERKNDLIEKQMLFRMFMMDPKSDASMSYFATMRGQYLVKQEERKEASETIDALIDGEDESGVIVNVLSAWRWW